MTNAGFARFDARIFGRLLARGLADSAVYYANGDGIGVPCKVVINRSAQYQNQDTGIVSNAITIAALRADIGSEDPSSRSIFMVDLETFVVDRVDESSDDGRVVVIVTPRRC